MIINLEYKEVNQTKSITIQTDVTQTFLEFIKHIPNISKYSISDYVINSQEEMEIVDEIFKILQSKYESPKQYQSRIFESIIDEFRQNKHKYGVAYLPLWSNVSNRDIELLKQYEIDDKKKFEESIAVSNKVDHKLKYDNELDEFIFSKSSRDNVTVVHNKNPNKQHEIKSNIFSCNNPASGFVYELDNNERISGYLSNVKIDYLTNTIYVDFYLSELGYNSK